MLEKRTIVLYREKCNCGWHIRHNNGGNYHAIDRLHLIGDDDIIYCVILEETDTRESFPSDQYEVLVFQDGKFRLEDEDWADEADVVYTEEGYSVRFRQSEAEILYQNPWAFTEAISKEGEE